VFASAGSMNTCYEFEFRDKKGDRISKIKIYNKTVDMIQKKTMKKKIGSKLKTLLGNQ
jgi:hypothetical protein